MNPRRSIEGSEITPPATTSIALSTPSHTFPTESELVLLCLDYLRDLRRVYPTRALQQSEGLDSNYLTIACWALQRAFTHPPLADNNNDAHFDKQKARLSSRAANHQHGSCHHIPTLTVMEKELLYTEKPHKNADDEDEDQKKEDDETAITWYEYDDTHPSNLYRFYPSQGLASGPALKGALTLGEITAAGLAGLGARSRLDAEKDIIRLPLFDEFLKAVQSKGFFDDLGDGMDDQQLYEERFRKVVAKFRNKLASKDDGDRGGELVATSVAAQHRQRRAMRIHQALLEGDSNTDLSSTTGAPSEPASYVARTKLYSKILFGDSNPVVAADKESVISSTVQNPMDLEEAEKLKTKGNTHMQRKEYQEAANCYTEALKLSPSGLNSHVYFSNRAAAMISMKRFQEAIEDSERSLALRPDYGKAHARLGLAHFLLENFRQAMEAYTVALKYEPDNKSSQNYLEKAAKRLAESNELSDGVIHTSYSVVSEWDKSSKHGEERQSKHYAGAERYSVADEKEAEKYKDKGNLCVKTRDYSGALDAYTKAIQLCPNGSNTHVYYSNRAAALCYLERYAEAEKDSLKSLDLNPNYGKAHARLGLSRFFLQDYQGAVASYTAALEHDPGNVASRSYLAKAQEKLEASRIKESPRYEKYVSPEKPSLNSHTFASRK